MRRVIGSVVLVAGVGGLGWFASTNQAVRMEAAISQAANAIAAQGVHGVTAAVAGRDITVTGITETSETDMMQAGFDAIPGRRIVNLDGLDVLPVVPSFEMRAMRGDDLEQIEGIIPLESIRDQLRALAGDAQVDALVLADGEPDDAWGEVAVEAYVALGILKSGQFRLNGFDLEIAGIAATLTEQAAFEAALGSIPDNYRVVSDIEIEDDGTPMRLNLTFDGETLSGDGKLPVDLPVNLIGKDVATDTSLVQASIPSDDPQWVLIAEAGVTALLATENGTFSFLDRMVRLAGQVLPENQLAIDFAVKAMREFAPDYDIAVDVQPYDDGVPFSLNATYDGRSILASGKVPSDFRDGLDDAVMNVDAQPDLTIAFIKDDSGTWPEISHVGLRALATMEDGTLQIEGDQIRLSGTAISPRIFETTTAALGGYTSEGEIAFLDDDTPIAMVLTYTSDAAFVSGKLPADLTPTDISEVLGVAVSDDETIQSAFTSDSDLFAPLFAFADSLQELDSLTFSTGPDGSVFDAVAAPGVDADQLGVDLTASLGDMAQVSVVAAVNRPTRGATRTNRFTGREEVFTSGYWLPQFDFRTSIEACTEQSDALLSENKVRFLPDSADLDVPSIRAINGLAALTRKCALEAGAFLKISGHTDNSGDAATNLALSQARADAVRDAILARGVARIAVSATGFGDSQPIEDNETETGRAANRRTEFRWVFE